MNPTISVTPNPAPQGGLLTVSGAGYTASGSVYVWFQQGTGNADVIANPVANSQGAWSISVGLAPSQPQGTYYLWAQDLPSNLETGKTTLTVSNTAIVTTATSSMAVTSTVYLCSGTVGYVSNSIYYSPACPPNSVSASQTQTSTTTAQVQSTVTTIVIYTSSSATTLSSTSQAQTIQSTASTSSTTTSAVMVTTTITQVNQNPATTFFLGFPQLLSISSGTMMILTGAVGFVRRIVIGI